MKCKYEGSGWAEGRCMGTKEIDLCPGYDKCSRFKGDCQTNADHIRSMTDAELAEWIEHITKNPLCYTACARRSSTVPCNGKCCEGVADWLKQPYEEVSNAERVSDPIE